MEIEQLISVAFSLHPVVGSILRHFRHVNAAILLLQSSRSPPRVAVLGRGRSVLLRGGAWYVQCRAKIPRSE
ncbi:hypothetical protein SAY87_002812 [Trapa incisa]|uniref:Uncharacterized protein n=1 Tax=Trapa incisa TaxID=236973 RepID=A0AAN7JUI9_9MYRT|nr:hypothetical protein SAY87_002812 [Trapa incisa]